MKNGDALSEFLDNVNMAKKTHHTIQIFEKFSTLFKKI